MTTLSSSSLSSSSSSSSFSSAIIQLGNPVVSNMNRKRPLLLLDEKKRQQHHQQQRPYATQTSAFGRNLQSGSDQFGQHQHTTTTSSRQEQSTLPNTTTKDGGPTTSSSSNSGQQQFRRHDDGGGGGGGGPTTTNHHDCPTIQNEKRCLVLPSDDRRRRRHERFINCSSSSGINDTTRPELLRWNESSNNNLRQQQQEEEPERCRHRHRHCQSNSNHQVPTPSVGAVYTHNPSRKWQQQQRHSAQKWQQQQQQQQQYKKESGSARGDRVIMHSQRQQRQDQQHYHHHLERGSTSSSSMHSGNALVPRKYETLRHQQSRKRPLVEGGTKSDNNGHLEIMTSPPSSPPPPPPRRRRHCQFSMDDNNNIQRGGTHLSKLKHEQRSNNNNSITTSTTTSHPSQQWSLDDEERYNYNNYNYSRSIKAHHGWEPRRWSPAILRQKGDDDDEEDCGNIVDTFSHVKKTPVPNKSQNMNNRRKSSTTTSSSGQEDGITNPKKSEPLHNTITTTIPTTSQHGGKRRNNMERPQSEQDGTTNPKSETFHNTTTITTTTTSKGGRRSNMERPQSEQDGTINTKTETFHDTMTSSSSLASRFVPRNDAAGLYETRQSERVVVVKKATIQFVPRAQSAELYYEKHQAERVSETAMVKNSKISKQFNVAPTTSLNARSKSPSEVEINKAQANDGELLDTGERETEGKALQSTTESAPGQSLAQDCDKISVEINLPACRKRSQNSLQEDISSLHVLTPEQPNASTEPDSRALAALCSVNVTPSVHNLGDSPYSLTHPDDEHVSRPVSNKIDKVTSVTKGTECVAESTLGVTEINEVKRTVSKDYCSSIASNKNVEGTTVSGRTDSGACSTKSLESNANTTSPSKEAVSPSEPYKDIQATATTSSTTTVVENGACAYLTSRLAKNSTLKEEKTDDKDPPVIKSSTCVKEKEPNHVADSCAYVTRRLIKNISSEDYLSPSKPTETTVAKVNTATGSAPEIKIEHCADACAYLTRRQIKSISLVDASTPAMAKPERKSPVVKKTANAVTQVKVDHAADARAYLTRRQIMSLSLNEAIADKGAPIKKAGHNLAPATTPTPKPWVATTSQSDSTDSSSGDETDEEELMLWAQKMFGISPPIAVPKQPTSPTVDSSDEDSQGEPESRDLASSSRPTLRLQFKVPMSTKTSGKRGTQRKAASPRRMGKQAKKVRRSKAAHKKADEAKTLEAEAQRMVREAQALVEAEEAKRKKELAKPLSAADVRRILADDQDPAALSTHWVRRSMRQPSRSALHSPNVQSLLEKLRINDYDMTVLKMKKYLPDLDTPPMILDAALDALEENSNCQALYIQNFNEGMRDEQVLHLLKILQLPTCNIWCLNIGETYNVTTRTWGRFAKGLQSTKITHMYASEHTITTALKDEIREAIRKNRSKHDMHINPENLDVIVQCTHCWWNPVNAKILRPYLSKRGLDHILHDKEAQGLRGSATEAPAGDNLNV